MKVGDKVQKGQVVCIIEAMKLMNEIEVSSIFHYTGVVNRNFSMTCFNLLNLKLLLCCY